MSLNHAFLQNQQQSMAQADAQELLEHLHAVATGIDGELVLIGVGEDPATGKALRAKVERFKPGQVDAMLAAAHRLNQEPHRNVGIPLAVMRPSENRFARGSAEDVLAVLGLLADLDDANAKDWRRRLPMTPSMVLETSAGRFQAFFLFDRPAPPDQAQAVGKALAAWCRGDVATGDVTHCWKLPGVLNWPTQKKMDEGRPTYPQVVDVVEPLGRLISIDTLADALKVEDQDQADAALLAKARNAANGEKFKALFDEGDASDYASESEADMALFGMLAFWCKKDPEKMERLFLASALGQRAKAERSDYIKRTIEKAVENCRDVYQEPKTAKEPERQPTGTTAAALMNANLPQARWAVPGLIPEGLTILGGKPKAGKSWLGLNLCCAIAGGGGVLGAHCQRQRALYLALEDSKRRLQSRLLRLSSAEGLEHLDLFTDWPRTHDGGLDAIKMYLADKPDVGLIVVDTLQKLRGPRKGSAEYSYQADYEDISALKSLADSFRVAVVVIHHLRKMEADDPFDALSGTTGLSGAADTLMVLTRERSKDTAQLWVTGRDVEENRLALKLNTANMTWQLEGQAEQVEAKQEDMEILAVLKSSGQPQPAKWVMDITRLKQHQVYRGLERLKSAGIVKVSGIKYRGELFELV